MRIEGTDNKSLQEIITIDAEKLTEDIFKGKVEYTSIDPQDEYCDESAPIIEIDFENPKNCPYVKSVNMITGNAVFYQIGSESLLYRLIYFDFGNAFNYIDKSTFENSSEGAQKIIATDTEKELLAEKIAESETKIDFSLPDEYFNIYDDEGNLIPGSVIRGQHFAEEYMDFVNSHRSILENIFNNGLFIRSYHENSKSTDDPTDKHFVPFDKSASMGRRNTISFIDENILADLNKRLLLDMDLSNVDLNLAKFYAYKGLYFTSSKRINSEKIILNSDTVIVIDDIGFVPNDPKETIETITAIPPEEERESSNQYYTICNKKMYKSDALKNLYDGEGLICLEYSKIINEELGLSENTASYQVRLPFTKGMLHKVDFIGFIKEYGHLTKKAYVIKDAFGKTRNLMNAKIILTKSMFKCFDWYSDLFDNELSKDLSKNYTHPLDYYFEKFSDYNHALYIANTDDYYQGKNLVQLNYQFLNTLCLTDKEYDSLLNIHREAISDPVNYLMNHAEIRVDDSHIVASEKWKDILLKYATKDEAYKGLYSEPLIKENLKKVSTSIRNKMAFGKYIVNGEIRFLSRDLLFLLYQLLNEKDRQTKKCQLIKSEFLPEAVFDMPGNSSNLKSGYHYAILRNPHLSRNEQCALRFEKAPECSIRYKYLSHLKGIIMLSHLSVDPLTLGGADFDGDLVKVINNDIVRDSILKNRYNLSGKYKPHKVYTRSEALPVININPYKVEFENHYVETPDFDIIANTFSNNIGQLSNLSAKYGKLIYSDKAFRYYKKHKSKNMEKAMKSLVVSMDNNLMSLKLNKKDERDITFGIKKYKLKELKKLRKSNIKEVSYENLPKEYTDILEEISLENLCPSLTIYTGMDIDAPKNNIRPNIKGIFKALAPLNNTYNYLDNFKYRLENSLVDIDHMPKSVINGDSYQLGKNSYKIYYPLSPAESHFSIDLIPYFFFNECMSKKGRKIPIRLKKHEKISFINENDKDTKETKNSEEYSNTVDAIEAYVKLRKDCQKKIKHLNYVIKAERLKKIRIICQAQYNNDSKYDDFLNLYEEFLKFDFDYDKLKSMHNNLALSDWQFLSDELRPLELKNLLKQYIEPGQTDILECFMKNPHISMLYNFNNKGYFLLYLMIGHALNTVILSETRFVIDENADSPRSDIYIRTYNRLAQIASTMLMNSQYDEKISFNAKLDSSLKRQWLNIVMDEKLNLDTIRVITDEKKTKVYNEVYWDSLSMEDIENKLQIKKEATNVE